MLVTIQHNKPPFPLFSILIILLHLSLYRVRCLQWRRGDLMASPLDSGSRDPGSRPGRGHCVVFLGKTMYSHSASLHPSVSMGTGKFNAGRNPVMDQLPRGEQKYSWLLHATETGIRSGLMGHLTRMLYFTFTRCLHISRWTSLFPQHITRNT